MPKTTRSPQDKPFPLYGDRDARFASTPHTVNATVTTYDLGSIRLAAETLRGTPTGDELAALVKRLEADHPGIVC